VSFNLEVADRASAVAAAAITDVLGKLGTEAAVAVRAPAGAGKSYFVGTAVGDLRIRQARVAVCAPTNEQAYDLVALLACRYPAQLVTFLHSVDHELPPTTLNLSNVTSTTAAIATAGSGLVVGTIAKLGYSREDLGEFDVLLMDEAFQADAGHYYTVAALAPTHLLVGDSGQLNPFSTMDRSDRWRGLAEDPLQTAIGVLLRNHPETSIYPFPISRRLDPRAVEIVRAFYPGHSFDAAVLPGVRQLRVMPALASDPMTGALDQTIETAAAAGWAHLELPQAPVLTADPETISAIVALVRRLSQRGPEIAGEYTRGFTPLQPNQIACGVSHNDQKDYLRAELDGAGFSQVVVDTANKLQGRQFDLVIAWHPLAGLPDPDGFHLDPGRLCVLLTRHRQACILVGRESDRALVEGLPPATPAYLGSDPDPVLDGWDVHQAVFRALEAHRVAAG
jgi:hypothetical protein